MFNVSNVKSDSPMFCKKFIFRQIGPLYSTVVYIDLAKAPVGMNFLGNNKPSYALMRSAMGNNCEPYISLENGILRFEFPVPPAIGEMVEIELELYYQSVESKGEVNESSNSVKAEQAVQASSC